MKSKNKKEKINFKHNLSEYWSLLKNYKFLFLSLLVITLIVETLFVADKFLFKRIIDDGTSFLDGVLSQNLFVQTLIIITIVFVTLVIIRTIGKWISLHLLSRLDAKIIFNLKKKYFNHILKLSHSFHTTHKTGSLISRMTRGVGAIENLTDIIIFNFSTLFFQLLIVGISLAIFSVVPALVLLGMSIVFISYSFYIQQIQQKSKLEYINSEDREKGFISDVFMNIDSIKYYGKEKGVGGLFAKASNKVKDRAIKYVDYYRWFDAGQIFILGIGTFLLIYFPLMDFLSKEITLGTLVFIYTVYGNVVGPLFGFVWGMRGFYRSMADLQELFAYGKIENDIKDKPNAQNLEIKEGTIEFKDVSFNYGKRKAFSLDNFNLKIKKNEKVAFIGHSGCGKTTLIKLLYRFYDVNSGQILIDGQDIRNFNQESVRGELSIVPQECVLFDSTIFSNIKFSNPKASKQDVLNATKFAQIDGLIKNLPNKEKTIVGERGVKLSGGEKQRVSIARAILADKKVLVLDEATSSLDSETEHEIQKDLQKLLQGRTSIIIAHRLSTIMNADRIIVMKRGRIVQEGNHKDLLRQPGEYRKLWKLQKGGYIK